MKTQSKKWWQADTKWDDWYDSLNPNTRAWLKKQAVWHDSDMVKAFLWGAFIGFVVAWITI